MKTALVIALALVSAPAFADPLEDCSAVNPVGEWSGGMIQSTVIQNESTQELTGIDAIHVAPCFGTASIKRLYYRLSISAQTCIMTQEIQQVTRATMENRNDEKDETASFPRRALYYKVQNYTETPEGRTIVYSACKDPSCSEIWGNSNTMTSPASAN